MQKARTAAAKLAAAIRVASIAALILFLSSGISNTATVFSQSGGQPEATTTASTIRVTGEASTIAEPDQAVLVLAAASAQPSSISSIVGEERWKAEETLKAIMEAAGGGNNDNANGTTTTTTAYVSHSYLYNQHGSSYGDAPTSYDSVTFSIYSSVPVPVAISQISNFTAMLAQAELRFETVAWEGSGAFIRELKYGPDHAGIEGDRGEGEEESSLFFYVIIDTKQGALEDILAEYRAKYGRLLDVASSVGISRESIRPANVSFNPELLPSPDEVQGYGVTSRIIVKTGLENVDKIVALAQEKRLNVDSISLSASDSAIEKIRQELTLGAIEDARSRAVEIAGPLGLQVGGIRNIEVVAPQASAAPYYYGSNPIPYRGVVISSDQYSGGGSTMGRLSVAVTVEFDLGAAASVNSAS